MREALKRVGEIERITSGRGVFFRWLGRGGVAILGAAVALAFRQWGCHCATPTSSRRAADARKDERVSPRDFAVSSMARSNPRSMVMLTRSTAVSAGI